MESSGGAWVVDHGPGVAVVNYDITSNEGEGLELTRPVSKNDDERLEQ